MQMYFHHVGLRGSAEDFPKTVYQEVDLERIEVYLDGDGSLRELLRKRFPSGSCNVWGVPAGAHSVIRDLASGDTVLLVETTAGDGRIPALCPDVLYRNRAYHELSRELWGNARFPYVFFFETELIEMTWQEMCLDLGYNPKWDPRYFVRITPDRLESYGGVEGYLRSIQQLHGASRLPFTSPTDTELSHLNHDQQLEPELVLSELQCLAQEVQKEPVLTQGLQPQYWAVYQRPRSAAFRLAVLRLYDWRCAVCGSDLRDPDGKPEVQAAHIYSKKLDGSDDPRNGICLCARHHWAFDVGWISLSDDYSVLVRSDLPDEEDYAFIRDAAGKPIQIPSNTSLRPHALYLIEHRRLHHFTADDAYADRARGSNPVHCAE